MNILVLNGSPKGDRSITLQSMKYLAKNHTDSVFDVLNVGAQIRAYQNADKIIKVKDGIANADLVVIAYPVYTFLAPAQLHKFFEIMQENGIDFAGKYVTQFTTSKRFYDVTAHSVVKEICLDLGGKYIDGLSADMEDLLSSKGRQQLDGWWGYVIAQAVANACCARSKNDANTTCKRRYVKCLDDAPKSSDKRIVVVTDNQDNPSLDDMIMDFCAVMPYAVDVVNLNEFDFKCGCLGCLRCAIDGKCAVNDGFEQFLGDRINSADAVLMAFTIQNHATSSLFKTYYDRQFFNGHRPITAGKPTGYIVSGELSAEPALVEYIEAKSAVGGNQNCGVVTDEGDTSAQIKNLAFRLAYYLDNNLQPQTNFYEQGGMRIFRDMIWIMRGIMRDDYKFYKKHHLLNFPQKQRGKMLAMKLVGALMRSKRINRKMPNMLADGMMMPYDKFTK